MATVYGNNSNNRLNGTTSGDYIYAYGGNDTIYGYSGNDVLDGGSGIDAMYGGTGDDTYILDNYQDLIYEYSSQGIDKVRTYVYYQLGDNLENLTLLGTAMNGDGNRLNNVLYGNELNNRIDGYDGNDTIYGNAGNDDLGGGSGNDFIDGGTGNDSLNDYSGNDTYIFNRGYGQDVIFDYEGNDIIKMGSGITYSDLEIVPEFVTRGNEWEPARINLAIKIKGTNDKITIQNGVTFPLIESIRFADGNYISLQNIIRFNTITGSGNNDNLPGTNNPDFIYGREGNDTLTGGRGNDYLNGGAGYDTYVFNKGDGQDIIAEDAPYTIKFGTGITKNDLIINEDYITAESGSYDFLYLAATDISLKNSTDNIKLGELPYSSDYRAYNTYKIAVEFADGAKATLADLIPVNINGTDYAENIIGNSKSNVIRAYAGNDTIQDTLGGNDTIYAGSGNDYIKTDKGSAYRIYGEDGNDVIEAVGGHIRQILYRPDGGITEYSSDYIDGGNGNDTITDEGGSNTIYGGQGDDKILVKLEAFEELYIAKNDYINGGSGYDSIIDEGGNDTLIGGLGNDTIVSYDGFVPDIGETYYSNFDNSNDTYLFNRGDGQDIIADYRGTDTINFGSGIYKSNVTFTRNNYDVIIGFNNSTDKITVKNWYYNEPESNKKIETLKFADGSSYSSLDIERIIWNSTINPTVRGTSGNDYYSGRNGNDIYYTQKGNDIIKDYYGNETYIFNKGDGQDLITDTRGTDRIRFEAGLTGSDLTYNRVSNNLSIGIKGTNDKITVVDWFRQSSYQIERLDFSDGTSITNSQINQLVSQIAAYKPDNSISSFTYNLNNHHLPDLIAAN